MLAQVLRTQFPTAGDLILCAITQRPLEYTTKPWDHKCLNYLIESYLSFVKTDDIYGGDFWTNETDDQEFSMENFLLSLQMFFAAYNLWESGFIKGMKQEHLRILVFIATLRYRSLEVPLQQLKYGRGTASEQGIFDIFLIKKGAAHPAYAFQLKLLTTFDLNQDGQILDSKRGIELQKKGLVTFEKYLEKSKETLISELSSARTCAYNAASRKKQTVEFNTCGYVVLVSPYQPNQIICHNCGVYYENLTQPGFKNNLKAPFNLSGLQNRERGFQRGQSGSQLFSQNPSLPMQLQTQENLINSTSQQNTLVFPTGSQPKTQYQAKREADPDYVSWKAPQLSHIPENDHDSSIGHGLSNQFSASQDHGSMNSWKTNWTAYNRMTSSQIPGNEGFGYPISQPVNFPSGNQPLVAFPNPNLMMSLMSSFYGSDEMSNVSTEVSRSEFNPKSNC